MQGVFEGLPLQYQSPGVPDQEQDQRHCGDDVEAGQRQLDGAGAFAKHGGEPVGMHRELGVELGEPRRQELQPACVSNRTVLPFGPDDFAEDA
nr:hypothetical protein [Bradyrhizobium sp. CCBAU 15635]